MADQLAYEEANLIQRGIRSFAASGPGSWLFVRVLHRIDKPVYRLTDGRHTLANLLSGIPEGCRARPMRRLTAAPAVWRLDLLSVPPRAAGGLPAMSRDRPA